MAPSYSLGCLAFCLRGPQQVDSTGSLGCPAPSLGTHSHHSFLDYSDLAAAAGWGLRNLVTEFKRSSDFGSETVPEAHLIKIENRTLEALCLPGPPHQLSAVQDFPM